MKKWCDIVLKNFILLLILSCPLPIFALDKTHVDHQKESSKTEHKTESMPMHNMDMTEPSILPMMAREGSGTAWQPDTSPMPMILVDVSNWQFMFHGNIFAGGDFQGSTHGDIQPFSINWLMASVRHKLGAGQFSARGMLSLEPLTVGGNGYPLLFQTGETWQGQRLHDRQHPHDLFMELALKYLIPVGEDVGLEFYVAPAGEPALGPVAFPHRISSRSNPLAPLGHHWYDSTHMSFGVLTMGIFGRQWKLEASWFNGREPDENRYNIDLRVPDSYAGRISYNPIKELSLQASYGFLKSPEPMEPEVSVHKTSSSVSANFKFWKDSNLASTIMFGLNIPTKGLTTGFVLAECDFDLNKYHTLFSRLEGGTKTGEELVLSSSLSETAFLIGTFSLGYTFRFPTFWHLVPALGGVGTLYTTNSTLGAYYNGPVQAGGMVFVHLRAADHE